MLTLVLVLRSQCLSVIDVNVGKHAGKRPQMNRKGTSMVRIAEEDVSVEALPRRTHTVGTRLSHEEVRQLTAIADERQVKVGDVLRELILEEISRQASPRTADPLLAEIVGVRLLLVNLMQPRDKHDPLTKDSFEALLGEIKRMKKKVALDIERESGRR
jgi:hypothetical protein